MPQSLTVLHLNDAHGWRGGERQTLLLAEGLHRRGHRSIICGPSGGELVRRARKSGIETATFPFVSEWDIYSIFLLRRFVRNVCPHLVHTHTAHAHTIGLAAVLGIPETRLVVSRRVDFHIRSGFLSRMKYHSKYVNKIVAISEAVRNVLLSDGIPKQRIRLAYSGIELDKYKTERSDPRIYDEFALPPQAIIGGCVAALAAHKAHEILIQAAQIACRKVPLLHILLIGDGERRTELERLAKQLNVEKNVHFLGFRTDIGKLIKSMDFFVLSSRTEGLGTSVLDAMACGLPIVATQGGGIPEMVTNQFDGLLAPVDDFRILADKMVLMSADKELRSELGKNALTTVKRFSIDSTIDSTISVYREILEKND